MYKKINRQNIYERTEEMIEGKRGSIFIGYIIVRLIPALISFFGISSMLKSLFISSYMSDAMIFASLLKLIAFGPILFIVLALAKLLESGLQIEVYKYSLDGKFHLGSIFTNFSNHLLKIVLYSLMMGALSFILNLIPAIGWILALIASYLFSLTIFVLVDRPEDDIVENFKTSYRMMKDNVLNLFLIRIKYAWPIILGYFVLGFGGLNLGINSLDSSTFFAFLGWILFILGLALVIYFTYKNITSRMMAEAVLYGEIKNEDDEEVYYSYED